MTTLDLDALERAARAATQAHVPFEIKEGRDYAEVIDRNGEKVALTVRPNLFRLIEQFPALISDHRALQERVEGAREALEQADFWLEGALNCKTWNWDDDQRAAATDSLAVIRAARTKAGEPRAEQGGG